MKPLSSILTAALAGAVTVGAEESAAPFAASRTATEPCRTCRSWGSLTYGAGWGDPLGRYASFGIALGDVRYAGPIVGMGVFRVALLQADLGRGGLSASFGTPMPLVAKLPRSWEPLGVPLVATAAKVTLLRTWSPAVGAPPEQTYLGGSVEVAALVHFRLGLLGHVSGNGPRRPVWTWGVGLGF